MQRVILRKQRYIVYLKDSEEIIQILNVMEAHRSLMELENIRIIKDMRNSANRQSNCDSANINKMVRTAARQVDDIRYIEEHFGFEQLPPQLREMRRCGWKIRMYHCRNWEHIWIRRLENPV